MYQAPVHQIHTSIVTYSSNLIKYNSRALCCALAGFHSNSYNNNMCWKCKNPIEVSEKIYRNTTCEFCGADLHSCRNCKFYDIGSHYDCRENISSLVKEKERANFCEWFSAREIFADGETSVVSDKAAQARDAFASLFGETATPQKPAAAKDAFNALFGD